jgi:hypothetical protein
MRTPALMVAGALLAFAGAAMAQATHGNRPPPPPPGLYPPPPGYGNQTISCGSPRYHLVRCPIPREWRGVRIIRQTSSTNCVEGRNWGYDRGGIWVDKGCGGVFAAGYGGEWQPGPGWDRDFVVSCGSPQYRYYFCRVDVGRRGYVRLQHQDSDAACTEGRSWGWNRAGIWVDKGCGAHFMVTRRW